MEYEEIFELEREVFPHYCKDGVIKCADPYRSHSEAEKDLEVLTISRIDGDEFRPKFCYNVTLLKGLKRANYPQGYQVLCENCQALKLNTMWNRRYW